MINVETDLRTLQQAQTALEIVASDLRKGGAPDTTWQGYAASAERLQVAIASLRDSKGGHR